MGWETRRQKQRRRQDNRNMLLAFSLLLLTGLAYSASHRDDAAMKARLMAEAKRQDSAAVKASKEATRRARLQYGGAE